MGALKSDKCSQGHKMVEGNLYHRRDGKRECLTCKRERNRGRKSNEGEIDGDSVRVLRRNGGGGKSIETMAGQERASAIPGNPARCSSDDYKGDIPAGRICRNPDCGKVLIVSRGFYVCADVNGCALGGQQQGRMV